GAGPLLGNPQSECLEPVCCARRAALLPAGWRSQSHASLSRRDCRNDKCPGEAVPAAQRAHRKREQHIGNVACCARTTLLIVDDGKLVSLTRKPQHGLHEIISLCTKDPRRAQNNVLC